jgi:DegV family protein with EDD domain
MEQKGNRRIAIVTDSTADIPADLVEEYGIYVASQILIMGDNTWRDGVDIDSPTFYELLEQSLAFPSTSQPSVSDFTDLFLELSREFDGIVAIVVSEELSGTLNSAQMAAASLPNIPIEIIDSRAVSMNHGFHVLAAAQAAAAGADHRAVADAARTLIGRTRVYFVVDTLEYLHRGGRIGAAARLVGSALNLKPLLEIKDGIVTPMTRVRTRRKALDKVLGLLEEQLAEGDRVHMAVLHVAAPEDAARFGAELQARFHPVQMIYTECGPVVGAHAGPGTVGVAFYVE